MGTAWAPPARLYPGPGEARDLSIMGLCPTPASPSCFLPSSWAGLPSIARPVPCSWWTPEKGFLGSVRWGGHILYALWDPFPPPPTPVGVMGLKLSGRREADLHAWTAGLPLHAQGSTGREGDLEKEACLCQGFAKPLALETMEWGEGDGHTGCGMKEGQGGDAKGQA